MRFSFAALLAVAAVAVGTAATKVPSQPILTPPMEAAIRATFDAHLERRPEMRFNTTRLREIQERAQKADSTNDDTVSL